MSDFETMLKEQVEAGQMQQSEMDDLLAQKKLFDDNRQTIEKEHKFKYVGYVNGEMLVAGTMHALLAEARKKHPGKQTYFEKAGDVLFEDR